jgi:hypothetical protein
MICRFIVVATLSLFMMLSAKTAAQKAGGSRGSSRSSSAAKSSGSSKPGRVKAYTKKDSTRVEEHDRKARAARRLPGHRTHTTRAARSQAAKHAFEVQTGYPNGRPGYLVDHIKPLACGGLDAPSNMRWQTIAAAKAKHKTDRAGCR